MGFNGVDFPESDVSERRFVGSFPGSSEAFRETGGVVPVTSGGWLNEVGSAAG